MINPVLPMKFNLLFSSLNNTALETPCGNTRATVVSTGAVFANRNLTHTDVVFSGYCNLSFPKSFCVRSKGLVKISGGGSSDLLASVLAAVKSKSEIFSCNKGN